MPDIARVRIGKVTLKGGAELRVLTRPAETEILRQMREWASRQSTYERPPDAFVAVAFWWDEVALQHVNDPMWASYAPEFPLAFLPAMAEAALSSAMTCLKAEDRVMRQLGWEPVDPQDGAA